MKRMTLKSAFELLAEKELTRRMNMALSWHSEEAVRHSQITGKLARLAMRRNHLLIRSEDTSEVDAELRDCLKESER